MKASIKKYQHFLTDINQLNHTKQKNSEGSCKLKFIKIYKQRTIYKYSSFHIEMQASNNFHGNQKLHYEMLNLFCYL